MLLYHGSVDIVERPDPTHTQRRTDFGSGFYATTSFEQARRFARQRLRALRRDVAYVNAYSIDEPRIGDLRVLRFDSPGHDWLAFVIDNRMLPGFAHDYDLVIGPVADDRVVRALTAFLLGECDEERLLGLLKSYKLTDQWLFHTPAALKLLAFERLARVTEDAG